ncbi:MAG: hypothetical protein AAF724_01680 [Pseudomonadota bacterium]
MAEEMKPDTTLALSTKVEEDFVAPLAAMRGSLEILRDFPDLAGDERLRFIETAMRSCTRLEQAVKELGKVVYAAGQRAHEDPPDHLLPDDYKRYSQRIKFMDDIDTIEVDFSDFEFSNSQVVNQFYDVAEELIEATGRKWYLLVNYRDCSIWPEAWVAFAHRGKKLNVTYSLATVRYVHSDSAEDDAGTAGHLSDADPDMMQSRELALARLEHIKREA